MSDTELKHLTEQNFIAESAQGALVIDFYADWCGPCRALAPLLKELAHELKGQVAFAKVNTDNEQALATRFHITSLPTLILLRDGKEMKRLIGLQDRATLKKFATNGGA